MELIRAKVTRSGRELESISTLFGQEMSKQANAVSIQRWEVAPNVYRFTLSEALPPGGICAGTDYSGRVGCFCLGVWSRRAGDSNCEIVGVT